MFILLYIISVFCLFFVLKKIIYNQNIREIIRIIIIFYSALWLVIPSLITILKPEISNLFIPLNVYIIFACIEIIFATIILYIFHRYSKKQKPFEPTRFKNNNYTLLLSIVILTIYNFISSITQGSYLEHNDVSNTTTSLTSLAPFILIFTSVLYFNVIQIIISKRKIKTLDIISFILILLFIVKDMQSGSRITLLLPIFIFTLYILYTHTTFLKKGILIISALIFTFISLNIVIYISQNRANTDKIALKEIKITNSQNNKSDAYLMELVLKLNSIHDGAVLVTLSGMNFAGLKPYEGSLLAFVPRALFPNKPIPGSFNNTLTGIPARYTASLKGLNPEISNLGISASGISIWQLGIPGLILGGLFNIFNLIFINILLNKTSYYKQLLGFSLLQIPTFILINSGDVIIKNWITILFIYIIIVTLLSLVRIIKNSKLVLPHQLPIN